MRCDVLVSMGKAAGVKGQVNRAICKRAAMTWGPDEASRNYKGGFEISRGPVERIGICSCIYQFSKCSFFPPSPYYNMIHKWEMNYIRRHLLCVGKNLVFFIFRSLLKSCIVPTDMGGWFFIIFLACCKSYGSGAVVCLLFPAADSKPLGVKLCLVLWLHLALIIQTVTTGEKTCGPGRRKTYSLLYKLLLKSKKLSFFFLVPIFKGCHILLIHRYIDFWACTQMLYPNMCGQETKKQH